MQKQPEGWQKGSLPVDWGTKTIRVDKEETREKPQNPLKNDDPVVSERITEVAVPPQKEESLQSDSPSASERTPKAVVFPEAEQENKALPISLMPTVDKKETGQSKARRRRLRYVVIIAAVMLLAAVGAIGISLLSEEKASSPSESNRTSGFSDVTTTPAPTSFTISSTTETTRFSAVTTFVSTRSTTSTATEKSTSATVVVQNGYTVCPTCQAIYSIDIDGTCWYCNSEYAQLGAQCSGCGGYTGRTNSVHFECGYCHTVCCPYVYDGILSQTGLSYEDVHCPYCGECDFTEVTDLNPHHCSECGACYLETSITQEGLCEYCASLPRCTVCGRIGDDVFEGYCSDCESKVFCYICGADLTYRGYYNTVDGTVCEDCWTDFYCEPNVTCPYCAYEFFVSGVGSEGIECPLCGETFQP